MKRCVDIFGSFFGLLFLSPALFLLALWIKLDSKGPVFFRQERVGRAFRPFKMLKFRSMICGAEKMGLQLTSSGDQRVTRVGRLLRSLKLDELPQLINVLLGDMSLVGPRPEVPKYVGLFPEQFRIVLKVRPGMTDWTSIQYFDEEALLARYPGDLDQAYIREVLPAKLKLQIQYVESLSLLSDFQILLKTFVRIFKRPDPNLNSADKFQDKNSLRHLS